MAIFNLRWPGKKQAVREPSPVRGARGAPAESVEAMRRRARHRLIGATLLVLLAIIGFPMLFDTQPRPVAVNASIEIPDRERVAALTPPAGSSASQATSAPRAATDNGLDAGEEFVSGGSGTVRAPSTATTAAVAAGAAAVGAAATQAAQRPAATATNKPEVKPERKPEPTPEIKPKPEPKPDPKPKDEPKPVAKPEPKPEHKPEPKPEPKPKDEPKPAAKPEPKPKEDAKPKRDEDADRIRAMMEGRAAAASAAKPAAPAAAPTAPAASRYVVQVGAFAESEKASEVRAKLQLAGVSAFTQNVKTAAGNRVRVRVGPFNSKEEAERAAAKVKAQGLPASLVPM